jgi:hypothetical protein
MMTSHLSPTYGSIIHDNNDGIDNEDGNDDEEVATTTTTKPFDVSETYYLKDTSSSRSPAERRQKCLVSATPVMIACLIMGTIVVLLLQNFSYLYPTSAVDRNHYDSSEEHRGIPVPFPTSTTTTTTTTATTNMTTTTPPHEDIRSSYCDDHPKCNALELDGTCCPTVLGDFLDCC